LHQQLGFAIIPLIHFVSNKKLMGDFVIPLWQKIGSWIAVSVIVFLNCQMLFHKVSDWLTTSENPLLIGFTVIPFMAFCLVVLLYITIEPLLKKTKKQITSTFHGEVKQIAFKTLKSYSTIAITVDFSSSDNKAINKAIQLGGKEAVYKLIHVLESTNAVMYGEQTSDNERDEDTQYLLAYKNQMIERGYHCETQLGFGSPKMVIPKLVTDADLLVMGTHGHTTLKDLLFGTTVEKVRHNITIPLVLV
jgi:manganese transport protein